MRGIRIVISADEPVFATPGAAVRWNWLVVDEFRNASALGSSSTPHAALNDASDKAAEMLQPQGRPEVDVCAVEGCGHQPDPFGRYGQCSEHEDEARHAQGGGE